MPNDKILIFINFIFIFKKKRYLSEKMLLLQQIVGIYALEATHNFKVLFFTI